MNKIRKILTINISAILILLIISDLCIYTIEKEKWMVGVRKCEKTQGSLGFNNKAHTDVHYKYIVKYKYEHYKKHFRPVLYSKNSRKRPITLFGCSYTEGLGLKENQTFGYKLFQKTDRTVYNRGALGTGPQFILYQLRRDDFYKEVPDAEYFIYTFIPDHFERMYKYQASFFYKDINLRFELKNGKVEEVKPAFLPLYSLFTIKKIQEIISNKKIQNTTKTFNLFLAIMKDSIALTKQHYPNSKFIILFYKDPTRKVLSSEQIKRLEDTGFIVVDSEKLAGHELMSKQYRLADENHPSEKAWNDIVPNLVRYLNL